MSRIPWRLIGYAALALLLLFGANHALGFVPFTPQWQARQLSKKVGELKSQVSTLEREATGQAEIGQAVETFHTREIIIREGTAEAIAQARNAPDADAPLTDERANRLRSADFRLCDQFPGLCAGPDATAGGSRDVPASDPS